MGEGREEFGIIPKQIRCPSPRNEKEASAKQTASFQVHLQQSLYCMLALKDPLKCCSNNYPDMIIRFREKRTTVANTW